VFSRYRGLISLRSSVQQEELPLPAEDSALFECRSIPINVSPHAPAAEH
jgi:hypothetical protein